MEDYEVMVTTARPAVETVIRRAQDLHIAKRRQLDKSWRAIQRELDLVAAGDHPVLHALTAAHEKIARRVQPRVAWDGTNADTLADEYAESLATVQRELEAHLQAVALRERQVIDRMDAGCTLLLDDAVNLFEAVPLLGPSAVYDDVAEYMLFLASTRLTLVEETQRVIQATVRDGVDPSDAIERARLATQTKRDALPDSVLLLFRLLRIPLTIKTKSLRHSRPAAGNDADADETGAIVLADGLAGGGASDGAGRAAHRLGAGGKGKIKGKSTSTRKNKLKSKRKSRGKDKDKSKDTGKGKGKDKGKGEGKGKGNGSGGRERMGRDSGHKVGKGAARGAAAGERGAGRQPLHRTTSAPSVGVDDGAGPLSARSFSTSLRLLRANTTQGTASGGTTPSASRRTAVKLPPPTAPASKYGGQDFKKRTQQFRALPFSPIVTVIGMKTVYGRTKTPFIRSRGANTVARSSTGFFALPPGAGRTSGPGTFAGAAAPGKRAKAGQAPPTMNLFLPATPGTLRTKRRTWEDTQRMREQARKDRMRQEREARMAARTVEAAPLPDQPGSPAPASVPAS